MLGREYMGSAAAISQGLKLQLRQEIYGLGQLSARDLLQPLYSLPLPVPGFAMLTGR